MNMNFYNKYITVEISNFLFYYNETHFTANTIVEASHESSDQVPEENEATGPNSRSWQLPPRGPTCRK